MGLQISQTLLTLGHIETKLSQKRHVWFISERKVEPKRCPNIYFGHNFNIFRALLMDGQTSRHIVENETGPTFVPLADWSLHSKTLAASSVQFTYNSSVLGVGARNARSARNNKQKGTTRRQSKIQYPLHTTHRTCSDLDLRGWTHIYVCSPSSTIRCWAALPRSGPASLARPRGMSGIPSERGTKVGHNIGQKQFCPTIVLDLLGYPSTSPAGGCLRHPNAPSIYR